MTAAVRRKPPARKSGAEIIPFEDVDMTYEIQQLVKAIGENTKVLTELSTTATSVLNFIKRWTGWAVAAIAIAYPAIGQIIAKLPVTQ